MTKEGQSVNALLGLSFSDCAEELVNLPEPENSALSAASESQLAEGVIHFKEQLQLLLKNDSWKFEDGELFIVFAGSETEFGFWKLIRKVGKYFGYCTYRFARVSTPFALVKILRDEDFESPPESENETGQQLLIRLHLLAATSLLATHEASLFGLLAAAATDEMGFLPGELPEKYDADLTAIETLDELHRHAIELEGEPRYLLEDILGYALQYRTVVTRKRAERRQKEAEGSLLGANLKELSLLSVRDEMAIEKYGVKRLEKVFEQKLALIFQSFGFTVVPARPGEARADLLCIARSDRFTFLVDAMSELCSIGEEIPMFGKLFFKDCKNAFLIHLLEHLWEIGPLTELWVVSKTEEHKTSILGSWWAFLGGEHKGLHFSGDPD